jgi:hypothetical protein
MTSDVDADYFLVRLNARDGSEVWAAKLTIDSGGSATVTPTTTSSSFYVAGCFRESVDLGGTVYTPMGHIDMFIAEFDLDTGAPTWSRTYGDDVASSILPTTIVIDNSGNIVSTGAFYGKSRFGGSTMVTSVGLQDVFVTKHSGASGPSKGNLLWAVRGGGGSNDYGNAVAIGPDNAVYVAGQLFYCSSCAPLPDFGGKPVSGSGAGSELDTFGLKISTVGEVMWARRFGGPTSDSGRGIGIGSFDHVTFVGYFEASIVFDSYSLIAVNGGMDAFAATLNAIDGSVEHAERYGGPASEFIAAAIVDPATGDILIGGGFGGITQFGDKDLTSVNMASDGFLARVIRAVH